MSEITQVMAGTALAPRLLGMGSGPARVAALLLTMGKPAADKVLQYFDEDELRKIAETVAVLGLVPRPKIDELVSQVAEAVEAGADIRGSSSQVQDLLSGVLPPEKLAVIMSALGAHSEKSVWQSLNDLPEPVISQYLVKEHPQVAAFVLSRAGAVIAAGVLRHAKEQLRSELVRRLLAMRPVTELASRLLESAIREELLTKANNNSGPPVHARVADIINKMDRQQMEAVLTDLESRRPKDAKLVKGLLFSFDDIVKLSAPDRVKLFDSVPVERTIMSLHGASPDLKDLVLSSVSARSRRMIEQEISGGASPPEREVAKARRAIADLVLDMAERGLVEITRQADTEDGSD